MTLLKPTLIIKRLQARKSNTIAYDEEFHEGINVLNGCNGGGKTSIIQLLTYSLGYEIDNWKDQAKECDTIYLGIEVNGEHLTIRRFNRETGKQPMDICFMNFEKAIETNVENWSNHPYAIGNKVSFSQKLFSIMGIPEAKADANNNNITMHQILRLIYNNQSNIADCLFNIEPFDSAFKRESIGNYLLGLYDNESYDARIKCIDVEKKLDKIIAKLQAIYSVIGKTSFAKDLSSIKEQKEDFIRNITNINTEIQKIKEESISSYVTEKDETENQAFENIKVKTNLFECESNIQAIEYEIEDSKEFICELIDKSKSIEDSIAVGKSIPNIEFKLCPSCFKKIQPKSDSCCHVCGTEKENSNSEHNANLLRMKNEIDIQIRESERILNKKIEKQKGLTEDKKALRTQLRRRITKTAATVISNNSFTESKVFEKYREVGEVEEKISTLDKMEELHKSIGELSQQRDVHQAELNKLKELVSLKKHQFLKREPELKQTISEHLITILKMDIGAEKEFKSAESVYFDFASNTVSINGKTAFSESGTVYLNNAFHVALFLASLEKDYIRLPRLMILDGIENGGMEDARSQNFQKTIGTLLTGHSTQHQIIFATKSISGVLDNNKYIVGSKFTEENRSLNV